MASQQEIDAHWMRHAANLAMRGAGLVSPNPLVGCVIARGSELLGQGCHELYGGKHAEINALEACSGEDVTNATMYVTLEPCAHHGKQPPCADAIASSSIRRVVVGVIDPNPAVSGKGLSMLERAGIEVVLGIEQPLCSHVARYFLHSVALGLPYIVAKIATSQDNKISTGSVEHRWITNEASRRRVHMLRSELDAVMVGIGTVMEDNPLLDVRLSTGRNPARVIIDPSCRIDAASRIAQSMRTQRTIIVVNSRYADPVAVERIREQGAEIIAIDADNPHMMPMLIARALYQRAIQSILLEGGPVTLDNFMDAKLVQEVHIHKSAHVVGAGRQWNLQLDPKEWQLLSTQNFDTDVHSIYRRFG